MPTTRSGKSTNAQAKPESAKRQQKIQATTNTADFKYAGNEKHHETTSSTNTQSSKEAATTPSKSGKQTSSSKILEKGVLYFFIRGRVGIDAPKSVDDIARSYLILRPIGENENLHGALPATATSRLIALPKKTLPAGPQDRFMAFVEKVDVSHDNLREEFLKGENYETKTMGHRHSPDAIPVGEGVYVITTTGHDSHLSYMATLPNELGALQNILRFREKGRFIMSSKNPEFEGPANARLPEGPDYPQRVLEKFQSLRWMGSQPEFLDYPRAQILLIGHKTGLEKKSGGWDATDPAEVLSELEREDIERMQHLSTDESDAIYADLHSQKMAHPQLQKDL